MVEGGTKCTSASPFDPTQPGTKLYRLTGSTSNPGRSGGGTAHYRLDRYPIHFLCSEVESQLASHLQQVQVDDPENGRQSAMDYVDFRDDYLQAGYCTDTYWVR